MNWKEILLLIRPKHWVKNLLVYAPFFFAFKLDRESLIQATIAFSIFSLFASSIYVLNDIMDAERDRLHPKKRLRPIASGKVSVSQAWVVCAVVLGLAIVLGLSANRNVFGIGVIYYVINMMYSFGLKHVAILDVMIIALGFVFRVTAGAFAVGVPLSHWLLLCTFFISLFVASGKRKYEMVVLDKGSKSDHRKSIADYTDGFINQMIAIAAGVSVVFYSLYTIDPITIERFSGDNLVYTTPIVVFGILRYFHLLYNKNDEGDPANLFTKDLPLIATILVWIASIVIIHKYPTL